MKLKTEFHQKQQTEKIKELKEDKPSSSQPKALAEVREPIKMSFTLPKAQPKIKAAGFVSPFESPTQLVSAKMPPKQSTASEVKEESESPKPGKKM